MIAMADALRASHRGLIRLVCALRWCGALSSGEMFFGSLPSARVGSLLGHGDDDEDDEEERDEEEEEDDEDDDWDEDDDEDDDWDEDEEEDDDRDEY